MSRRKNPKQTGGNVLKKNIKQDAEEKAKNSGLKEKKESNGATTGKMAVALFAKDVKNARKQRTSMPETASDQVQADEGNDVENNKPMIQKDMEAETKSENVQKDKQNKSLFKKFFNWKDEQDTTKSEIAVTSAESIETTVDESEPDLESDATTDLKLVDKNDNELDNDHELDNDNELSEEEHEYIEELSLEFDNENEMDIDIELDELGFDDEVEDLETLDADNILQEKISEVTAFAEQLKEENVTQDDKSVIKFRKDKDRKLTLKQIATILQVEQSTIRFWEKEFCEYMGQGVIKGQRKWYNQSQLEMLSKIKELLQTEQYTIKGAKRRLELDNLLAASLGIEPSFKSTVFIMFAAIMQELQAAREESKELTQKVSELRSEKHEIEEKLEEEQNKSFLAFLKSKMHGNKAI